MRVLSGTAACDDYAITFLAKLRRTSEEHFIDDTVLRTRYFSIIHPRHSRGQRRTPPP